MDDLTRPCADEPDLFYADHPRSIAEAKALCGMCDQRAACLRAGLTLSNGYGVWGGLDPDERNALDTPPDARTCAMEGCHKAVPRAKNGRRRYCTRRHAQLSAERAYRLRHPRKDPAA